MSIVDSVFLEQILLGERLDVQQIRNLAMRGLSIALIASLLGIPETEVKAALNIPSKIQHKISSIWKNKKFLRDFIFSLWKMETALASSAVGDKGKSIGPLQIQKSVVDDVNRVYGTKYSYDDRKDLTKSIEIAIRYLSHYSKGRNLTPETLYRIWNGGPNLGGEKTAMRTKKFMNIYNDVSKGFLSLSDADKYIELAKVLDSVILERKGVVA